MASEGLRKRKKGNLGLTQKCTPALTRWRKWEGHVDKGFLADAWVDIMVGGIKPLTLAIREGIYELSKLNYGYSSDCVSLVLLSDVEDSHNIRDVVTVGMGRVDSRVAPWFLELKTQVLTPALRS